MFVSSKMLCEYLNAAKSNYQVKLLLLFNYVNENDHFKRGRRNQ